MPDSPQSSASWGKLLFEERSESKPVIRMAIFAVICIPTGIALFHWSDNGPLPALGLCLACLGVLFIFVAVHLFMRGDRITRFYARGCSQMTAKKTINIDYEEIDAFRYTLGVGNQLADCTIMIRSEKAKLTWMGLLSDKRADDLRLIRDAIAPAVAARIMNDLNHNGKAILNRDLHLDLQGIRVQSTGALVRYKDLDRPKFNRPVVISDLELTIGGTKVLSISPIAENYWPARILLDDGVGLLRQGAESKLR